MKKISLIVCVIFLLLFSIGYSQTISVGVSVNTASDFSGFFIGPTLETETLGIGLRASYLFGPQYVSDYGTFNLNLIEVSGLYILPVPGAKPYVGGGIDYYLVSLGGASIGLTGFHIRGGAKIPLANNLNIYGDLKYSIITGEGESVGGLMFAFGLLYSF